MNILIGLSWPYANGSLHIGHIASSLPADILARYFRAKGDRVCFVSGSDCHGTPVAIRAKQENKTPGEISDYYHKEFAENFSKLGFSFELYSKTSSIEHINFVKYFHEKLYLGDYVYEESIPKAYCGKCNQFLPDRFVVGKCPNCGENARGDQCEACGSVLEPENLIEAECSICGEAPEFKVTKHLYLRVTKFKKELEEYVESHSNWRKNAYEISRRYIREGLRDRAITRDIDWGIDVPREDYENKKIYIWAENVLGYLSDCYLFCQQEGLDFNEFWNSSKQYYVHGKDNIPFHTIILPSLLLARWDVKFRLPDEIISSEYLTLEGKKISTSRNWAIWAKDIIERYDVDSIRYFLVTNGPEKRDTDFSWREFVNSHNGELLGAYGNFVNRNLAFINKYFEGKIPEGILNSKIKDKIEGLYLSTGSNIECGNFKNAIDELFEFVRYANKYFDSEKPWETRNINIKACKNTIFNCLQVISNLAVLLKPFLPFSSEKLQKWLDLCDTWKPQYVETGFKIDEIDILFERIDKSVVNEEVERLGV